jgi:uncharacterized membrane protein YoaK (UPF0700 family)
MDYKRLPAPYDRRPVTSITGSAEVSGSPVSDLPATPGDRARTTRDALVVVLAVTSGATDAIGFLALGSAFTSVMTGNMVLAGVAISGLDLSALALTATAIGSFVLGAAAGTRVAGTPDPGDNVWPGRVTAALGIELALIAGFAAGWWMLGSTPPEAAYLPLLAVNAAALGLQSSAIQRFGVSGLSTTYLTGTLTAVVIKLVSGQGLRAVGHSLWILLGLVAGAAAGALLVAEARPFVPLLQLGTLTLVVCAALGLRSLRTPSG